jgi:serine/threonine-protein kinase RsbW
MMAGDPSGRPPVSPAERRAVRVPATAEGVRQAGEAFEAFRLRCGISKDAAWQMGVAFDEVVSNSVGHGMTGRPDGLVEVVFEFDGQTLAVTVLDDGPAFDPLSMPAPDTESPLDNRRPGGLGIYFVRTLMDRAAYERRDGQNAFTFARRVAGDSGEPGVGRADWGRSETERRE